MSQLAEKSYERLDTDQGGAEVQTHYQIGSDRQFVEPRKRKVGRADIFYNKGNNLTGQDLKVSNTVIGVCLIGNLPLFGCLGLMHRCEYKIEEKQHKKENVIGYKVGQVASVCGALVSTVWSVVTAPIWCLPILYVYAAYPE